MARDEESWEADGARILSPLRESEPSPSEAEYRALVEKTFARVHESLMASEIVEFATELLFGTFMGPALDLIAFALGLDTTESTKDADDSAAPARDEINR